MNPPTILTPRQRHALLYKAATLVAQLEPLAQVLATESFTSSEREGFRELAGEGRVFSLLEALRPICSAEAHAIFVANASSITLAVVDADTGKLELRSFPRPQSGESEGGRA